MDMCHAAAVRVERRAPATKLGKPPQNEQDHSDYHHAQGGSLKRRIEGRTQTHCLVQLSNGGRVPDEVAAGCPVQGMLLAEPAKFGASPSEAPSACKRCWPVLLGCLAVRTPRCGSGCSAWPSNAALRRR